MTRPDQSLEGLEADLREAVSIAYKYGAKDWVRMNYPALFEELEKETRAALPELARLGQEIEGEAGK